MRCRPVSLLLVSLGAIALLGCSKTAATANKTAAKLRPLTVDQVAARIAAHDGKTFVFDDNPRASWVAGHVPGAKWLAEDHVTASALPPNKAATLIFYCHSPV